MRWEDNSINFSLTKANFAKRKTSDNDSYMDGNESSKKVAYTFEEYMCERLKSYKDELQRISKCIKKEEKRLIRDFKYPLFGNSAPRNILIAKFHHRILKKRGSVNNSKNQLNKSTNTYKFQSMKSNKYVVKPNSSAIKEGRHTRVGSFYNKLQGNPKKAIRIRTAFTANKQREVTPKRGNIDALTINIIRRRKQLENTEKEMQRSVLKSGLNDILYNIDSMKGLFQMRSNSNCK